MELVDLVPVFNLYEEYWKIYTQTDNLLPQYMAPGATAERSIIGGGTENYGKVTHSVIGANVLIGEGSEIVDSIIMEGSKIGKNVKITKAIIAENVEIGDNCVLGEGKFAVSKLDTRVYNSDLVTIAENSVVPSGVKVGLNTAIVGVTTAEDYPNNALEDGGYIVKEG